jgi:hypothetical protein
MAEQRKEEPKKLQADITGGKYVTVLYIIVGLLFLLLGLHFFGIVDLTKGIHNLPNEKFGSPVTPKKCPTTSAEMGKPCCKQTESGELEPIVSSVYVGAQCDCPKDTTFLQMAPEGHGIKICDCNCK